MNTRPPAEIDLQRLTKRSGAVSHARRSRIGTKVERALNAVVAGEERETLNVSLGELLSDPGSVCRAILAALDQLGDGLTGQLRVTGPFRRAGLADELVNSLVSHDPATRAAAAQLCGVLRLTESVLWIEALVQDNDPKVRESAIRGLGRMGGRRAVDALMASADLISIHRLAVALAQAASDLDIEALMRQPASEKAAVVTVLACGLRRDHLRAAPLLGIAHDSRWPKPVRIAACLSLGMIGMSGAADMRALAEQDPDPDVKRAATRAQRRLERRARAEPG